MSLLTTIPGPQARQPGDHDWAIYLAGNGGFEEKCKDCGILSSAASPWRGCLGSGATAVAATAPKPNGLSVVNGHEFPAYYALGGAGTTLYDACVHCAAIPYSLQAQAACALAPAPNAGFGIPIATDEELEGYGFNQRPAPRAPKCECGARALGTKDYALGHASYCPTSSGRKP